MSLIGDFIDRTVTPAGSNPPKRRLKPGWNQHALERDASLTLAATLSEFECIDAAVAGHIEPIPSDDERLEMVQSAHGYPQGRRL